MKKKIIIHTPQNEISKNFRYYNYFWFNLIEYLKSKFDVIEDTYFEDANKRHYPIKLLSDDSEKMMLECEMIIENVESKDFVILSVSDILNSTILDHYKNPHCKKIIFSQYDENNLKKHVYDQKNFDKYSPWIYFPSNVFNIDSLYTKRKNKTQLFDKFCFWGTSINERKILTHFEKEYFDWGLPIGDFEKYSDTLINYKVALSISGRGEFCYRDIENFGLGIPIIRFEYINKMYFPLIPNFHYISVERPDDLIIDRVGEKKHADMILKRFIEVKDDKNFLEFISKNARDYYEKHLTIDNSIRLTYKILNLNEWE